MAAQALGITSGRLKSLGLIDEIIKEPLGGAHRAPEDVAQGISRCIERQLAELDQITREQLLEARYQRLMSYGEFQE